MTSDGRLQGLAPVIGESPRVLILGSMPSEASLAAQAYYAHPRNRFWPVLGTVLSFDPLLSYEERLDRIRAGGIALWDTIGSCERTGSLDSAILRPLPNPVGELIETHPTLKRVILNGGKAAEMWRRFGAPALTTAQAASIEVVALPSTSPANARFSLDALIALWGPALTR
ncbi:DNA-deoxyinosine glycosylase [Sutterella sp.]|uniref:DNA-deoxyinosine glycosylase n=1 Tax=Sutterella sp. TaxID=1981025 RepID=UPI0026DEC459|nr:DNA-deoxyinosine glycosylase [Sutterella sp.]MDO5531180.1 DNA-deoxyinosine glycosylase [Sutterella sp.]